MAFIDSIKQVSVLVNKHYII